MSAIKSIFANYGEKLYRTVSDSYCNVLNFPRAKTFDSRVTSDVIDLYKIQFLRFTRL